MSFVHSFVHSFIQSFIDSVLDLFAVDCLAMSLLGCLRAASCYFDALSLC